MCSKRMKIKPQEQKFMPQLWDRISQNRPQCGSHRRHAMRVASHSCMLCVRQAALLLESQDYDDVVEAFEGQRSSTVLIALWPVLVISNYKFKLEFQLQHSSLSLYQKLHFFEIYILEMTTGEFLTQPSLAKPRFSTRQQGSRSRRTRRRRRSRSRGRGRRD